MAKKSILDTQKGICFWCGKVGYTHLHHILYGKNHKIADREGLTCYLCYECHEGTNGVHGKNGAALGFTLKEMAQEAWEQKYKEKYPYRNHADQAAREAWMRMVGENYLIKE